MVFIGTGDGRAVKREVVRMALLECTGVIVRGVVMGSGLWMVEVGEECFQGVYLFG